MSRALVIGATGLLGRRVAESLERGGHEVHRASRKITASEGSHPIDLTDVDALRSLLERLRPSIVVQMTGGVATDSRRLAEMNIVPTVCLIEVTARLLQPPALFVTGSAAEYGDQGSDPVPEDATPRPLSPYGWIKVAEVATARELARLEGIDVTVIRPFNPVMSDLPVTSALGNFRSQLLSATGDRVKVTCGRVDVVRDFITGSFLGVAVTELASAPPGGIVNICSGVGVRLEDVMRAAASKRGVELELEVDPALAELPAPDTMIGDPGRLYSLITARADSTPERLAAELLG